MEETVLYNTERMRSALARCANGREKVLALIKGELESITGQTGEAMAVLVYEWRSLSEVSQVRILGSGKFTNNFGWSHSIKLVKKGMWWGCVYIAAVLTGALSWTTTWFKPGESVTGSAG